MYDFMVILDNNILMPKIIIYRIIYRIYLFFRNIYEKSTVKQHKNNINIFHCDTI